MFQARVRRWPQKYLKKIGREIPPLERREVKIRQRKSSLHLYYNKAKI